MDVSSPTEIRYEDAAYSIQPDHRYLFLLRDGDIHLNTFSYEQIWDLTTGVAVPNSLDDVIRVQQGQSVTAGLTEERFLEVVRQAIEQRKQQINQPVSYWGHIRGYVTDESGHPPAPLDRTAYPSDPRLRLYVELQRRDASSATGLIDVEGKQIDADGRYDFSSVPPGDYLVSVNSLGPSPARPYPRLYFPHAASEADAATIHLPESSSVDTIDLTLPNAWRPAIVHVRVLLPDGSPAVGAHINAHDAEYLSSGELAGADAGVDGRADFSVYEGRTYYLTAFISGGGTQQRCAGPLKFTGADGLVLDAITIEHNWGNCLAQLRPTFRQPR